MDKDIWRILIVDDSPEDREEIRWALLNGALRRYRFEQAETGAECLRLLRDAADEPYACVFLDYHLPDQDAPQILGALGEVCKIACPVVVLTGIADRKLGLEAIGAGAQDFVGKDWIKPEILTRVLENAVDRHALQVESRRMTQALKASETRLRSLFELSGDAIGLLGPEGFMECNPASYRLYGCASEEELLGKNLQDFSPPVQPDGQDSAASIARIVGKVLKCGNLRFEWRHRRPDGSGFDADIRLTRIDLPEGPAIQAIVRDITERKRSEAALRLGKQRLKMALDAADAGTWESVPATGEFFASERALSIHGMPPDAPMNHEKAMAAIYLEDRAKVEAIFRRSAETGESFRQEYRVQLADGSIRWLQSSGEMHTELDPPRIIGLVLDITRQKKLQLALRQSEQRYRSLFESSLDGVAVVDMKGRIRHANRAYQDMLGYSQEELGNMTFQQFTPLRWHEAERGIIRERLLPTGDSGEYEKEYIRKDGRIFPVSLRAWPLRDANGEISEMCGIVRDITERKRLNTALAQAKEEAERANRAKSLFLANMSHEIRTPIAAILGLTDLCLHENPTQRQSGFLDKIKRASDTLLHLVNDILDFSKVEAGKLELLQEPFCLSELLDNVACILETDALGKGLTLSFLPPPALEHALLGDRHRLSQVLINLVGNAIKFSPNGRVEVETAIESKDAAQIVLSFSVRDQGIGIAPEVLAKLFQPFVQAEASTTRTYGGTGLGLALSKRLAETMGGRIWAESAPGQGSAFHFTARFGIGERTLETTERAQARVFDGAAVARLRDREILVVEDNEINQLVIRELLQRAGCRVRLAENGAQALSEVDRSEPDAVLMDCQMPVMDGFEATRALRMQERHRDLPIIALTANAMESDRQMCLEAGMNDFVSKPASLEDLVAALARSIRPAARTAKPVRADTPASPASVVAHLPGIDAVAGLRVVGGNPALYVTLLRVFRDEHAVPTLYGLRASLRSQDWDETVRLSHNLKGTARTLGAGELGDRAENLERAARAGDLAAAETAWIPLEQALENVRASLAALDARR